jgi:hypothetical protein
MQNLHGSDTVGTDETLTDDDETGRIGKMRIKELKKELSERGQKCVGCKEKDDFVTLLKDTFHLPKINKQQQKEERVNKIKKDRKKKKEKEAKKLVGGYRVGDLVKSQISHGTYMAVGDKGTVLGPCDSNDWDWKDR